MNLNEELGLNLQSENEDNSDFNLSEEFELNSELGEGMFGKVYEAFWRGDQRKVALKFVKKKNCSQEMLNLLRFEESILTQLNHPNIVKFYMVGVFSQAINKIFLGLPIAKSKETPKYFVMALELAKGSSMKEFFDKGEEFDHDFIRSVMKQLLSAVAHIHQNRIVHRDVKPENIILSIEDSSLKSLKLIDFGLSFQIMGNYLITEATGTPIFFSPEQILGQPYGYLTDIWSCGLVFYMMFSHGRHPIYEHGMSSQVFNQKLLRFDVHFPQKMDSKSIDLFKKMCLPDPECRISATQALTHPWITGLEGVFFNPLENLRMFHVVERLMEIIKAIIFLKKISRLCVSNPSNLYKIRKQAITVQVSSKLIKISANGSSPKSNKIILPSLCSPTKVSSLGSNSSMLEFSNESLESPIMSPTLGKFLESKTLGRVKKSPSIINFQESGQLNLKNNKSSPFTRNDEKIAEKKDKFWSVKKIEKQIQLIKSIKSCSNVWIQEFREERLPSLEKNSSFPNQGKSISYCPFGGNEDKLPSIHKTSKFKKR